MEQAGRFQLDVFMVGQHLKQLPSSSCVKHDGGL